MKKIIITLSVACVVGVILSASTPSYLSSNIFWTVEDIKNELNQKNLDRVVLVQEQNEKKETLTRLQESLRSLQADIKQSTVAYNAVQAELNQINADIAKVPSPQYADIEKSYNDAILAENKRFSAQRSTDQQGYNDAVSESKTVYDERVAYIRGNNPVSQHAKLIAQAATIATNARKNALQLLTDKNLENVTQHQEAVNAITQNKLNQRAQRLSDYQNSIDPLFSRKNDILYRKSQSYSAKDALIKQENSLKSEIAAVDLRIREINTLVDGLDRQSANLEKYIPVTE